jgi:L-alanine-DL-glutamate epimerase-like enolase superfamily enzyme
MVDFVFKSGNRGANTAAIASIDTALWDLKARINDEPLWRTLRASSNRVRAYASGIDLCLSDNEIRAFYTRMAADGVCGGKLKIGLGVRPPPHRHHARRPGHVGKDAGAVH